MEILLIVILLLVRHLESTWNILCPEVNMDLIKDMVATTGRTDIIIHPEWGHLQTVVITLVTTGGYIMIHPEWGHLQTVVITLITTGGYIMIHLEWGHLQTVVITLITTGGYIMIHPEWGHIQGHLQGYLQGHLSLLMNLRFISII